MLKFVVKETIKQVGVDNNILSVLESFPDEESKENAQHNVIMLEK